MAKKKLIIIVPGVKPLSQWPRLIARTCHSLIRLLSLRPVYEDHAKIWKGKINDGKSNVLWFSWNRNPDVLSKLWAVKKLQRLINSKSEKIKLVGISIGGEIILEAIKGKHYKNISKAILVCSINETRKIGEKKIKIVNIYSSSDGFAEAAIETLSFFNGSRRLAGKNIININLPKMDHVNFCANSIILRGKYKGERPSDVVNEFL